MGRLVGATCRPTGHKSIISSGVVITAMSQPEDSESSELDSDVGFRPGYKPGRTTISITTYRPMGRTGAKYSGRPKNADRLVTGSRNIGSFGQHVGLLSRCYVQTYKSINSRGVVTQT